MSRRMRQSARGKVLLLVAVLLALVCVPTFAHASTTSATIIAKVRVFQEYKVPVSGLQNTFEYVIEPVEEDAPMPVDANGTTFNSFTLTREDNLWLDFPVEVTVDPSATPYVYHYMMRPTQQTLPDGLYYVDVLSTSLDAGINEYPLEIHVQPSNVDAAVSIVVPTVHVEEWDGPKVTDPGWRVSYKEPKDESKDQTEDSEDGQTKDASDSSSKDASSTSSASSAAPPRRSSTTSRYSLATTGDEMSLAALSVCLVCVSALLLTCALLLRRRAGERHA